MSILTIAVVVVILVAIGLIAAGALNLYAADPRARGVQLAMGLIALFLVGLAYVEVGAALAAVLFVVVLIAGLLSVLRKRGAV